ncbi:hypothetical protein LXL04_031466 [Taraxacum kok-saghyz]
MSAKYLHSLADENPDFQKQIGCMTGVFHIFNRNHIVSRNRILGHNRKRIPHGSLLSNNGTPERESNTSWSPSSPFSYMNRRSSPELNELSASRHQNLDLRDKVKDSMYREARGLSHNVLVELQDPNWYCNEHEPKQLSRSKSCQFKDGFSKIYPRFSYDGHSTTPKQLKEPPRFSLDSKQRSIHIPIRTLESVSLVPIKPFDSKSNLYSRNSKSEGEKGLNHSRPPSVVAKLMGLETFSDSKSTKDKDLDLLSESLKGNDDCGSIKMPKSTTCWKNPDLKPISRVPNESAPWKPVSRAPKPSSVYSEVDKRLKNLEFEQSGKDLRALKHILESMQAVESRKGKKDYTVPLPPSENVSSSDQESHIVIMKPRKTIEKGFINNNKVSKDPKDSFKPRKQSESRCPNRKRQSSTSTPTQEKSTFLVKVDESEYPSPVSVLDDSVYIDNSPSPLNHSPNTQKDYGNQNLAENFPKHQHESTKDLNSNEKLQKVKLLVQKLKRLNSNHNESSHTDYIASLCENTNPNSKYISEIFLASGILLQDLEFFKIHSSNHPINPDLFLVLERTKFGDLQTERVHRKMIFDVVNEILLGKLDSVSFMVKNPRDVLRDVCLEIEGMEVKKKGERCDDDDGGGGGGELERVLREDVVRGSDDWAGFSGGRVVVGVEIEWLIFRDLVNELVMSEATNV